MVPPPEHEEPAGQFPQVVRVFWSPPLVVDPAGHIRHASACPAAEYLLSAPQLVQADAPSAENVPAGHSSITLSPSHLSPAVHVVQAVRVVVPPPLVYFPAGQSVHEPNCPACENLVSAPHSSQSPSGVLAPNFPAGHWVHVSEFAGEK